MIRHANDALYNASPSVRPHKKIKVRTNNESAVVALNAGGIAALQSGDSDEAERFFTQALSKAEVVCLWTSIQSLIQTFAPNDPSKLNSSNKLISVSPFSPPEPSISLKSKLDTKTISKERRPSTTKLANQDKTNLVVYIQQRQDYDEGMTSFQQPLDLHQCAFDVDRTSGVLNYNLGLASLLRSDFVSAEKWFRTALSFFEKSGTEHNLEETQTLHNIGFTCYRQGNSTLAIQAYADALACAWKLLDTVSRQTLEAAALNCIGVLTFHKITSGVGHGNALIYLEQSLAIYKTCCGEESTEVATVLNNIGRVQYLKADYKAALETYNEALRLRRAVLGEDSVDVAATMYNFAQTHSQLGNLEEAMELFTKFLTFATRTFGEDSRDVAIVHRCIGDIHQQQKRHPEALAAFQKALSIGRATLGLWHPEIASCLNKLGNLCYEMKRHEEALQHYQDGLLVEQRLLQPCHPHIIITLTNMAHIYKNRGEYNLALSAYRQVLDKQKKTFGPSSIECAVTLSSVGLMQYHLKYYHQAFSSYQEALRIRRDIYGSDDHADIASTLNSIGLVLFKQNLLSLSKNCFTESLRIRHKLFGKDHKDVAILWYNIATIYFEMGEEERAIQLYKETLRVERVSLGKYHSDVVLTLQHIGQVLQQLGKLGEAMQYYQEALDIEQRRKDADPITAARIQNLIGNIHLQRNNVPDMMKSFIESSRIYQSEGRGTETLVVSGYNFYGLSKMHPECAPVA